MYDELTNQQLEDLLVDRATAQEAILQVVEIEGGWAAAFAHDDDVLAELAPGGSKVKAEASDRREALLALARATDRGSE